MASSLPIAIIGAGISGLACGHALKDQDIACEVFEKSRGPGGRLASRRLEKGTVDLGAPYFTARHEAFRRTVQAWQSSGVVEAWPQRLGRWHEAKVRYPEAPPLRYCGAPRMSALTRYLAEGLNVRVGCRIQALDRQGERWWLTDDDRQRHGPYSAVAISIPTPQAAPLLAPHASALANAPPATHQHATWTAYAIFDKPLTHALVDSGDWQGLFVDEGPLHLVARNGTKPGRAPQENLSLLATHAWSEAHLEEEPRRVAGLLYQAFATTLATRELPKPLILGAHRWRYAEPVVTNRGCPDEIVTQDFHLTETGLGLCGDAWRGARVEDAWLSGHHLGLALTTRRP